METDSTHLEAHRASLSILELRLSNERQRLHSARTEGEKRQRTVWVQQIEKEIRDVETLLGTMQEPALDVSDEELLALLSA
jgi:hypothetical protein